MGHGQSTCPTVCFHPPRLGLKPQAKRSNLLKQVVYGLVVFSARLIGLELSSLMALASGGV
jgi:hypothetical protein